MLMLCAWCGTNISNYSRDNEQINKPADKLQIWQHPVKRFHSNVTARKWVQVTDRHELGAKNIIPGTEHGYESQLKSTTPCHESNHMAAQQCSSWSWIYRYATYHMFSFIR